MFKLVLSSILVLLIVLPAAAAAPAQGEDIYFTRTPAISPDGSRVVFSYEEDLWIVAAKGGTALRLTALAGSEKYPRFSPDGKWLAFSGSRMGNYDVYVMPVAGGAVRQLTFHNGDDRVDSWSWDSQHIYFNSDRYNNFSEYKVKAAGGTPRRIFGNYFNTIHGLVEHPADGSLYFTDTWESLEFANRKRYKGDYNPDIKSYNPETKEYKEHTSYRGKDFAPVIDRHGSIYFLSDRDNNEYNLYTFKENKIVPLTNFPTSIMNPAVSADGRIIVFEKDYRLFTYDVKTKETKPIPVKLAAHRKIDAHKDFNVKGKIDDFDISPDGKKIAFISRGELFASGLAGKFIRKIATAAQGRVMEVKWFADSKTLLFSQTVDGWLNLFKIRADKDVPEVQLTSDKANNRNIALNEDRSQALYLSGRNELKLMDLTTFKSERIVEDEFWGYYNSQPYFSPGGHYIVYAAYRDFEKDIFVYSLETGETVNLTDTGLSESNPCWSPDGKYLFFAADRMDPDYPRGGQKNKIYRLGLQKYDRKYRTLEFDKLFKEEKKKEEKKKEKKSGKSKKKGKISPKPVITFDYDDLIDRWDQVSPNAGGQWSPYVICKGDEYTVLYISNHDGERANLWKTSIKPFEPGKTKKIKGARTGGLQIARSKDKYYILINGAINELNLTGNSLKPIKMDYIFRRSLGAEFKQMFYEVWANLHENFYDETFHGVDWVKIREHYERFLPHIRSRDDLRRLFDDMLGELNASHLGFRSTGDEEKTFYKATGMQPGILFAEDDPYRVEYIIKGSASDRQGIDVEAGDILTAVNDRQVEKVRNREFYFTAPSLDREMKLTFRRGSRDYSVFIHPEDSRGFKRHLYDEWIRTNRDMVDKMSDNRIAYIHMKNMGRRELRNFMIEMTTRAYKKEALILDLRYNTGGNVHDAVLNFLSRRPYTQWKYRGGKFAPQPNFAPAVKPIALLINEQSLSDAEMTAAGFKALKLGKVIGTETYRWLIFTSGKGLVDGSFYRLPSWGCYMLDGKDIERHGVAPDIYIKNTFKDRLEGKDRQLKTAVEEIKKQLDKK